MFQHLYDNSRDPTPSTNRTKYKLIFVAQTLELLDVLECLFSPRPLRPPNAFQGKHPSASLPLPLEERIFPFNMRNDSRCGDGREAETEIISRKCIFIFNNGAKIVRAAGDGSSNRLK